MEAIPVRDAFGKSNGFRRPGYVISVEPGLMWSHGRYLVNLSALMGVTDIVNNAHGDAAFTNYTIIAGLSRTF